MGDGTAANGAGGDAAVSERFARFERKNGKLDNGLGPSPEGATAAIPQRRNEQGKSAGRRATDISTGLARPRPCDPDA